MHRRADMVSEEIQGEVQARLPLLFMRAQRHSTKASDLKVEKRILIAS